MARYILQHKDDRIAELEIDRTQGIITSVICLLEKELLVPRASRSEEDLALWWRERAIPASRVDLKALLHNSDISTSGEYLVQNLGLSLNDCYWIRPEGSDIKWNDVNLFSSGLAKETLEIRHHSPDGLTSYSFSPDASTGGDLPKWWIEEEGKYFLLKGNAPGSEQQSYNELLATLIHRRQEYGNYVSYTLCRLPDGETGCRSLCFTDEGHEFISAWDLVGHRNMNSNESLREKFIKACIDGGLSEEEVLNGLAYQTITDFLISNSDRHLGNFGVMRDSSTLRFTSLAPIFDSGNSMAYRAPWSADIRASLNEKVKGFSSSVKKNISTVKDFSLVSTRKLPALEEVKELFRECELSERSFANIITLYRDKVNILTRLQSGESFQKAVSRYF